MFEFAFECLANSGKSFIRIATVLGLMSVGDVVHHVGEENTPTISLI